MNGASRLVLRVARSPSVNHLVKPLARALVPRWLSLLPADLINNTDFSGFCCLDALPAPRFLMHRDPTSLELATKGLSSFGGEGLVCFAALLPQTRTFLDIGANTGVYSLMAAAHGVRTIHAFEPVPMIHERLSANIAANRFVQARAHQIALTDRAGSITLYVPSGAMPTEASTREGFRPGSTPIEVRAQTVDEFLTEHRAGPVDLMKIDTESTEPSVIEGAFATLSGDRPIILCEILQGLTEDRLHALLDRHDYRYHWITDQGLQPMQRIVGDATYRFLNYLFVPVEKEQFVVARVQAAFARRVR